MEPQFVRFVRAVEGRLVSRWDVGPTHYFGARLGTPAERADGKSIIWNTEQVIPLTAEFVARFPRELAKAIRHGDLEEVKADAYAAWIEHEEKQDAEANPAPAVKPEATQPAAAPAAGSAPAQANATPDQPKPESAAAAATEPKPEKRK